jgi:hypothetical protein
MQNVIENYLDIISKWPTSIPPDNQWFTYIPFETVGALQANIFSKIRNYETGGGQGTGWEVQDNIVNHLISPELQAGGPFMGCIFANTVMIPNESITAENTGLRHAGFQAPATVSHRDPQGRLSIKFIETTSSFIDFVLRPWTILVGHLGFVTRADQSKNVKASFIDVVYLGKSGAFEKEPIKRKIFRFHNIAPVKVQGMSNSYAENSLKSSTVDFIYDYYTIENPNSAGNNIVDKTPKTSEISVATPKTTPKYTDQQVKGAFDVYRATNINAPLYSVNRAINNVLGPPVSRNFVPPTGQNVPDYLRR